VPVLSAQADSRPRAEARSSTCMGRIMMSPRSGAMRGPATLLAAGQAVVNARRCRGCPAGRSGSTLASARRGRILQSGFAAGDGGCTGKSVESAYAPPAAPQSARVARRRPADAMRLWSIHPKYLDAKGLVALWREALLARAVLRGRTRGYRHHPQLDRFRSHASPRSAINAYLAAVHAEASARGYAFDRAKVGPVRPVPPIAVT